MAQRLRRSCWAIKRGEGVSTISSLDDCASRKQDGLFIIAPAFNEAEGIISFLNAVAQVCRPLSQKTTLIVVNDGSSDDTLQVVSGYIDGAPESVLQIVVLDLSRNFGHQAAIHAGLVYAYSIAGAQSRFIIMDADLQHPPSWIPSILEKLECGYDHVQMVRDDSEKNNFKSLSSKCFYAVFKWLSNLDLIPGSSDFRGFNHAFLEAYLNLPESDRFVRGIFHWLGYNKHIMKYVPEPRCAGETKYSLVKMIKFALLGITSFSQKPLLLFSSISVVFAMICCISYIAFELYRFIFLNRVFVLGWMSLFFVVSFFGAIILCNQLILSLYVSHLFNEQKKRPVFLIKSIHGQVSENADNKTIS